MRDFYTSLPTLEQVDFSKIDNLSSPYLQCFKQYKGVRVLPDESYVPTVPGPLQAFVDKVRIPCYVMPLYIKDQCYGFLLRSVHPPQGDLYKMTPRFCTLPFLLPGVSDIKKGDTVYIQEGLKDSFLLRHKGLKTISMMSSGIGESVYKLLSQLNCKVVITPDYDEEAQWLIFVESFIKQCVKYKIPYRIHKLSLVNDLGQFFDGKPKEAIQEVKAIMSINEFMEDFDEKRD